MCFYYYKSASKVRMKHQPEANVWGDEFSEHQEGQQFEGFARTHG